MSKRTKVLRWRATAVWSEWQLTLSSDVITLIKKLIAISRDITIKPVSLTASFGIADDPTDERIAFMVGPFDPDTLPLAVTGDADRENVVESTIWDDFEGWRAIGTDAGPTDVDEEARSVKLGGVFAVESVGSDTMAICAVVLSTTTSAIFFHGEMIYDVEYRQITYNNDGTEMSQFPGSLGGA